MKILMVWDGNYPWDVRVEKILLTLNEWGYETHLVCRNSNAKPRREVHNGTTLWRLFAFRNALLRKLNSAINFPAFFSPLWLYEIYKAIRHVKPDLIIIRDLPIAGAVVPLAKRAGIPTVFDMAECYPELIRCVWQFDKFELANVLVRNPYFADAIEKYVIHNVDLTWVMVEESAARLVDKGVEASKMVKVSNTPRVSGESRQVIPSSRESLNIVYIGLVNPSRGVTTVVEAAEILRARGFSFNIKIVGSGKAMERVTRMVEDKSLQSCVELAGWIDHKELAGILEKSDVGLVPHFDCSHWNNTIPNKLFDYMKAGIPVVVSDVKPAKRIVRHTGCGLVFRSGDAEDLADKLESLGDNELRCRLARAGVDAVAREFNWEQDSARMKASIEHLVGRH